MTEMAKQLIVVGVIIAVLGVGLLFISKIPGAGKLPGDIFIKKENFTFYFPLASCILLSILLSVIMAFFRK